MYYVMYFFTSTLVCRNDKAAKRALVPGEQLAELKHTNNELNGIECAGVGNYMSLKTPLTISECLYFKYLDLHFTKIVPTEPLDL